MSLGDCCCLACPIAIIYWHIVMLTTLMQVTGVYTIGQPRVTMTLHRSLSDVLGAQPRIPPISGL